jgi:predicted DNA-binding transcriptional regulator YafY
MNKKQQCLLQQYRSGHSQTITDRTVEPFAFTESYEAIWAYEPAVKDCRQFKLARMEKVMLTPNAWIHENRHAIPFTDAFGFAATKPKGTAQMRMNLLAANLLREEYPLSEKHITQNGDHYAVSLPFADYRGIGRFIWGLHKEIEVIGPTGLKKYLEEGRGG